MSGITFHFYICLLLQGSKLLKHCSFVEDKEVKVYDGSAHNLYMEIAEVRHCAVTQTIRWITDRCQTFSLEHKLTDSKGRQIALEFIPSVLFFKLVYTIFSTPYLNHYNCVKNIISFSMIIKCIFSLAMYQFFNTFLFTYIVMP